ncbi:MAG: glutamate 5-kinase [Cellvibrionales bacterium]|nr:glutamate 5-kinase [Cellvibrionales bacterium]
MTEYRERLKKAQRVVVKIGSALLTDNGKGLNQPLMRSWAAQLAELMDQGKQVVLVSSGAVAEGVVRKGFCERPTTLAELQAAAALGQSGLVEAWQNAFEGKGKQTAQILLVHDDVVSDSRYQNAKATLNTLLDWGVVPVVNENDTVANEELKFGDNDSLAAIVANIVKADVLILLTDQEGMFDADPRKSKQAQLITESEAGDGSLLAMAGDGGKFGRGGMQSKVKAAELASCAKADTVIASGLVSNVVMRILDGETLGTLLYSPEAGEEERQAWFKALRQG